VQAAFAAVSQVQAAFAAASLARVARARSFLFLALLLATLGAGERRASADGSAPASDEALETARREFAEGVRLFEKGDIEGARRLFEQADRDRHAPVIVYNLARAEERLGHVQAAVDDYERYLAEAGADAECAQAAAVAVALIRASSCRVRIESSPPGARVFVDGSPLGERTPTRLLLSAGQHHIVIEGEASRAEADVATQAGTERTVTLDVHAPGPAPAQAASSEWAPAPETGHPEGLVVDAAFVLVPYAYASSDAVGPNHEAVSGVDAGVTFGAGFAFAPRAVFGLRGLAAMGSQCKTAIDSHVVGLGPSIAYRLADVLWIGGSLLGGNGRTCREQSTFSTDWVFSPTLDFAVAVATRHYGQWLITASVGYFFANSTNDNRLLYVPVGFGARFF